MNAARRYAHRSMLSVLAGMVLVTLLTVSASTAAAGGNAAIEQVSAVTVGARQVGKTELEIVEPQRAQINDLVLYPGERPVLSLTFSATADSSREFELLVNQFGPSVTGDEKADLGGVLYQLSTGQR